MSVGLTGPCEPFFGRHSLLWWHSVGFTRSRLKLLSLCHRGFGVRMCISLVCVIQILAAHAYLLVGRLRVFRFSHIRSRSMPRHGAINYCLYKHFFEGTQ
jgi:hypothetical protein